MYVENTQFLGTALCVAIKMPAKNELFFFLLVEQLFESFLSLYFLRAASPTVLVTLIILKSCLKTLILMKYFDF